MPPLVIGFAYGCLMAVISSAKQFFLIAHLGFLCFPMLQFILVGLVKALLLLIGGAVIYRFKNIDIVFAEKYWGFEGEFRDFEEQSKVSQAPDAKNPGE